MENIYITAVPLPSNFHLKSQEITNVTGIQDIRCDDQLFFPVTRLIEATMDKEDTALVISVRQVNIAEDVNYNFNLLKKDIDSLNIRYNIIDLTIPENQESGQLLELFQRIAAKVKPFCNIFADSTFGTKTYPLVLFSILQYAEKVKMCQVQTVIYQEQRRDSITHRPTGTYLWDISSLFYLTNVVNSLSPLNTNDNTELELMIQQKDDLLHVLLNLDNPDTDEK